MTDVFVFGGVRTPLIRYAGSLPHIRLDDLLGMTLLGACERAGVEMDQIEDIAAGVNPAHEGLGDVARWAAMAAGLPDSAAEQPATSGQRSPPGGDTAAVPRRPGCISKNPARCLQINPPRRATRVT
jgi:acetyl-CoA acetyltransferase